MFIERNVFYLKFGTSRQANLIWKDFLENAKQKDDKIRARLSTDLTGRGYTLVLELYYDSFAEIEPASCRMTKLENWKSFYSQFIPLCESSERVLYKVQVEC
ncbi:MAG: hypothetical protein K0Q66_1904 [Chitinophagaceae bacterium]|jgi:hypothetical protein|nr:hypothetical protein [Chitinophagaceae bacterium]